MPDDFTPVDLLTELRTGPPPVVSGEPVEVADGVFVIPDRRVLMVPNVGIVVGRSAALIVDTGLGTRSAAHVLDQARRLAGDRRLFLTVTHFHPEHGFGASVLRSAATVVYNAGQRAELARKGEGMRAEFAAYGPAAATELDGIELAGPDLAYETSAELDLGGRTARLRAVGPAHTAADQIVRIDDEVLFCGDLAENRYFPVAPYSPTDTDVDGDRWIGVLDDLVDTAPAVVVPGHGEIGDAGLLRQVRDCLVWIRAETDRLRTEGRTAEETMRAVLDAAATRWPTWKAVELLPGLVNALYDRRSTG